MPSNYKLEFDGKKLEICVAPVYIHLATAKAYLNPNIIISAQNTSQFIDGAYTGEISAKQLKDFGITWTIIGHSERRNYYKESDEVVGTKVKLAQEEGLNIILCIGEKLDEREANKTWEVCEKQLNACKDKVKNWAQIVLAYEPVWAIGTGKNATPEQAQEVHELIRKWLTTSVSDEVAKKTRIIYGGSVTEKNCTNLIEQEDIDGFLVGGASLKPAFRDIVESCNKVQK